MPRLTDQEKADILRYLEADKPLPDHYRNRNTIEFLGIWEQLNNPGFKPVEFDGFKSHIAIDQMKLLVEDAGIKRLRADK